MKQFKRTLVTSALPYANGPVHIGHLAGVYVPADIYVRYLRLRGEEVLFVGGSDEHGVPVTIRAKKEGVTPQDVVDRYHTLIKKSFEEFGISFDVYSRTTSATHHKMASDFSARSTTKANLSKKHRNNTTTRRRSSSWPTATSRASVRTATPKARTATNAKNAAPRSRRSI